MEIKLLTDRVGFAKAIEEEREKWAYELLAYLGVDSAIFKEKEAPAVVDFLFLNKIEIIDYPNIGALKISYENETIGEWAGPEFVLKRDEKTGELHYEVTIECWSILDEAIDIGQKS